MKNEKTFWCKLLGTMVTKKKEVSELKDQKRESVKKNHVGGGAPRRISMVCDDCGTEFAVNALRDSKVNVPGEDNLHLTYITCPVCHRVYRVTLIDNSLRRIKEDVDRQIEECLNYMRMLDRGDSYGFNQLNGEIQECRKRYEDALSQLNDRYPGEFYLGNPRTGDGAVCVNAKDDLWYRGPELG